MARHGHLGKSDKIPKLPFESNTEWGDKQYAKNLKEEFKNTHTQ